MRRGNVVQRSVVLVAVTSALVAACGSTAASDGTSAASARTGLRAARCMRAHGVSNFPDPRPGGGFSIHESIPAGSSVVINGVTINGPAYTAGLTTCDVSGAIGPKPLTGQQENAMVAKAHCIRTHGVPDLPYPSFGPGGMGVRMLLPASYNPEAPAARHAAKACASVGTNIPGVGVG